MLFLVVTLVLAALATGRAQAAITTPFTTRYEVNTNGSILLRGNANLVCPPAAAGCVAGRNGVSSGGESLNNNGYTMRYADADGNPATFNDSSATVTMPPGSTVLFAGLYWSADPTAGTSGLAAPLAADEDQVEFRTPASATWNPVTASRLYPDVRAYQAFADVTALVAGAGDGVYGVADIQSGTGVDRYAGWALAVAYQNPAEDMRALRIYDGFGSISSGSVDIPVTGFETPHTGVVHTRIGAVAYEGDLGKTGDSLQLNGQSMNDAANPATNFFNSSVSDGGSLVGGRNPSFTNLMGVDIDQLDASGKLGHSATQATLTLTTAGETYYPGVVTVSIDLYAPKLVTTMTSTDLNGGNLLPSDTIEYRIVIRNDGSDTADNTYLTDAIPVYTTYVPGSLTVQSTPVTDAIGDDNGSYAAGAAGWTLGNIPYLGTTYVTFRVKIDLTTPAGYAISNLVNLGFTGHDTGTSVTSTGGTIATTVLQPHADLSAGLAVSPAAVQRAASPSLVTYTATVTNNGTDLEPTASAELTLPAGVTPDTPPAGCTAVVPVVTCALGPLLPGTQAAVAVPAFVDATAAADPVAVLRAYGSGTDTTPGNDTDSAAVAVNSAPQPVADSATTTNGTPVTVPVRANDTDPDDPTTSLTVSIVTPPAHGTAVVEADNTVRYTPALGWKGADTLTYQLTDPQGGTGTAVATVTTANAVPIANDDVINTPGNTGVTLVVLSNDTDPNGDPLVLVAAGQPASGQGAVSLAGNSVTYQPAAAFAGRASFTYTVADSEGAQTTGQVHVDVANSAPTAADDLASTAYLGSVTVDVLANDTDPNHDLLTVDAVGMPGHGTATISANRIDYQAPAGFSGDATFTYTISDGSLTSTAQVTVTVANAPPVAADETISTAYGTPVQVIVLPDATDPNGDPLRVSGSTDPAHGTVVRNPDGTFTYTPDAGFSGLDGFGYTIDDGHAGTDTATVTVTVADGVAVARDDAATAVANVPWPIAVLANDDADPNGDPLTITVDVAPQHGTAVAEADGRITYRSAAGYLGADSFHYTLDDGLGGTTGATVTVGIVNTAPTARPDIATTDTSRRSRWPTRW